MQFKYKILLALAFASLAFMSCDSDEEDKFNEELVVQSVMYIGQTMGIKLAHTIPVESYYDPAQVAVGGADVRITVDGSEYLLTEAESGVTGYYKADAAAPLVATGERYDLRVIHDSDTITAATIAAANIDILYTNIEPNSSATPDTFEYGARDEENQLIFPIIIWNTDSANKGYAVLVENLEPNWFEDDMVVGEDNGPCESPVTAWTFESDDGIALPPVIFCAKGNHRVRIFSCDQALWDYFLTTYLGDQENRSVTNLSSGQGVFTAIDSDTAYFYLTDDVED